VIQEYVNHIAPYLFHFRAEAGAIGNPRWYRQNWMTVEFNLLYRWHSAVPSTLRVGGRDLAILETIYNNDVVTGQGLGAHFEDASQQPAGRIGLFNTDPLLWPIEVQSVRQARAVELAPYNDYRVLCRFPRVTDFDQISSDPDVRNALRELYGSVDRIELFPGLFAEDPRPNSVLPSLMGRMVGVDAFSQTLTNPLLAPGIFNEETFSPLGMEVISTTETLSDLVHRNVPDASRRYFVSMTRKDWQRA
jgi:prostaglandin-endoperoxide synthase 2